MITGFTRCEIYVIEIEAMRANIDQHSESVKGQSVTVTHTHDWLLSQHPLSTSVTRAVSSLSSIVKEYCFTPHYGFCCVH